MARLTAVTVSLLVAATLGCSPAEQRRANEKACAETRKVEREVNKAVGDAGVQVNSTERAQQKLDEGVAKAREAARKAQKKIDDATNNR